MPQPVTSGATPSSRHPPSTRVAHSLGGCGIAPAKATPQRVVPRTAPARWRSRRAPFPVPASPRTTPWCCIHVNVVVRQAPARVSTMPRKSSNGTSGPPGSGEAASP